MWGANCVCGSKISLLHWGNMVSGSKTAFLRLIEQQHVETVQGACTYPGDLAGVPCKILGLVGLRVWGSHSRCRCWLRVQFRLVGAGPVPYSSLLGAAGARSQHPARLCSCILASTLVARLGLGCQIAGYYF